MLTLKIEVEVVGLGYENASNPTSIETIFVSSNIDEKRKNQTTAALGVSSSKKLELLLSLAQSSKFHTKITNLCPGDRVSLTHEDSLMT